MKGLIFMPDITGFTNFVKFVPIDIGSIIINDLLTNMIENNPLELELSEIEGDAILFYKIGKPLCLSTIFLGFKNICEKFDLRYKYWKEKYKIAEKLSLKLIVHYGDIIVYNIKGFKKLYGETVIESHQLLKNEQGSSNYVLITEEYIKALKENQFTNSVSNSNYTFKLQMPKGICKNAYYFFSKLKSNSGNPELIFNQSFANI